MESARAINRPREVRTSIPEANSSFQTFPDRLSMDNDAPVACSNRDSNCLASASRPTWVRVVAKKSTTRATTTASVVCSVRLEICPNTERLTKGQYWG